MSRMKEFGLVVSEEMVFKAKQEVDHSAVVVGQSWRLVDFL